MEFVYKFAAPVARLLPADFTLEQGGLEPVKFHERRTALTRWPSEAPANAMIPLLLAGVGRNPSPRRVG